DVFSRPAERLVALLAVALARLDRDDDLRARAEVLLRWDRRLTADSAEAALFEIWWMLHLRPALLALLAPDAKVRALLLPGDFETLLSMLEAPGPLFGEQPDQARDRLLLVTLGAAIAVCRARLGEYPSRWAWGRLHHALFEHAASRVRPAGRKGWDIGPLSLGGSRSTPMNAAYRLTDFRVTNGASVRLIIDVGARDNSLCVTAPGQSGDPRSPHYADLAPVWAAGDYFPLLYSQARIAAQTEHRIVLLPA